jgi:hypothetical protein
MFIAILLIISIKQVRLIESFRNIKMTQLNFNKSTETYVSSKHTSCFKYQDTETFIKKAFKNYFTSILCKDLLEF